MAEANPAVELRETIRLEIQKQMAGVDQVVMGQVQGVEAGGDHWMALNGGGWADTPQVTLPAGSLEGDIEIIGRVRFWDWTPTFLQTLVQIRDSVAPVPWMAVLLEPTGRLVFQWCAGDALPVQEARSTAFGPGFPGQSTKFWRLRFEYDIGGGLARGSFATSDDGVNWTDRGSETDPLVNVFAASAAVHVWVGRRVDGFSMQGDVYFVEVRNGIGEASTLMTRFDANVGWRFDERRGATESDVVFKAPVPRTYTLRGSAYIDAEVVSPMVVIDGMAAAVPVVWTPDLKPVIGARVVLNGLRGGQQWIVVGVLSTSNPYEERTRVLDGQLMLRHFLQHLNFQETDDLDYPLRTAIIDVNSRLLRLLWADQTSGSMVFTTGLTIDSNGAVTAPVWLSTKMLVALARDGIDEGGEINFQGAGAWGATDMYLDRFQNEWRMIIGGAHHFGAGVNGLRRGTQEAYLRAGRVHYTTVGANTFTKADYPRLKAIEVECQGGGGAGGGAAATGAGQYAAGGGGNGGNYARSMILATDLDATEAITVGAGGTAGAAGNNGGNAGGDSIFDTISGEVRATGGLGGPGGPAQSGWIFALGLPIPVVGASVGDLILLGSTGGLGYLNHTGGGFGNGGAGGSSLLGPRNQGHASSADGVVGLRYGGGGGGGANDASLGTARVGGVGAPGIVIVTLYI